MSENIQSVRGMNDCLPDAADAWQGFEAIVRDWLRRYGYREMRTPILEHTGLFKRAIGEVTDIVEKEMYTFVDELNGESLTLRPEGTASSVRAVIQHNLLYDGGKRLWYSGPMFRHERPQKGRYRQFHQVGVEALGFAGPDVDAELIVMCADLWRELGIAPTLQLNTLGDHGARQRHRSKLIAYYEAHRDVLDADAQRRLHSNPLRILDSKNPAMQALNAEAPRLLDELEDEALNHFDALQGLLRANGIAFEINPRLVRGLDYYNRTVFEWVTDQLGAQGTVCAGGRYDGLVEQLGGKPAPAAGFAMGIERLLALVETSGKPIVPAVPDAYIVHAGDTADAFAWQAAATLRGAGLAVVLHCGGGSFKSQMKKADASRARYAVIIGDEEAAAQQVSVKPLRGTAEQTRVELALAIEYLKKA
ncbi:Histidyl-tRNA synthetase, class IIa [Thiobacillus denitrificans ATCC 25259]|uniref:Histidine--tRNA ligase n=1 Tax=Thiobacillus denitrificans (strain ATCC 25259 / T1) TaxID=292415 RepID=SYH_THIDA|nr:histidine--tRNA ligase [Thiobacillus denitrificans]Q3SL69.1 RecName: Full=Histidine--tRNA ligase; AltName: Full=Histidyl-tRNA synthetase; Short=HisRS [Thiobacillus denitrificans ATCC 25259]AAZ96548.1 Histidyl-tRNA synthetase, class IIa [Thiobacillus denitrificans ATCC 25259]